MVTSKLKMGGSPPKFNRFNRGDLKDSRLARILLSLSLLSTLIALAVLNSDTAEAVYPNPKKCPTTAEARSFDYLTPASSRDTSVRATRDFGMPVNGKWKITSAPGTAYDHAVGLVSQHAIDMAPDGSDDPYIYAPYSGEITYAQKDAAGNHIVIDHKNGFDSHFFHLEDNSLLVKVGDKVAKGQQLAKYGNTGNYKVNGKPMDPHLHWEMRAHGGKPLHGNPTIPIFGIQGFKFFCKPNSQGFFPNSGVDQQGRPYDDGTAEDYTLGQRLRITQPLKLSAETVNTVTGVTPKFKFKNVSDSLITIEQITVGVRKVQPGVDWQTAPWTGKVYDFDSDYNISIKPGEEKEYSPKKSKVFNEAGDYFAEAVVKIKGENWGGIPNAKWYYPRRPLHVNPAMGGWPGSSNEVKLKSTNMCVNAHYRYNWSPVNLATCDPPDVDQEWVYNGSQIKLKGTNMCLNAHYRYNWSPVNLATCDPPDPDQEWVYNGSQIKLKGTNMCLNAHYRYNWSPVNLTACDPPDADQDWVM